MNVIREVIDEFMEIVQETVAKTNILIERHSAASKDQGLRVLLVSMRDWANSMERMSMKCYNGECKES